MNALRMSIEVAAAGLHAQAERVRVVSENIANAHSVAAVARGDPYRRKTITFASELSRLDPAARSLAVRIGTDSSPFGMEHDPGNPAADASGNVKKPNVNVLLELADMREANHAYEADLQMLKQASGMISTTISMLRDN
jgi:flagellar basal-body rod protein FlgC